jgi:hypothetical protein
MSAGLLAGTEAYLAALSGYRAGEVVPIIGQLCQTSDRVAAEGRWLIDALDSMRT